MSPALPLRFCSGDLPLQRNFPAFLALRFPRGSETLLKRNTRLGPDQKLLNGHSSPIRARGSGPTAGSWQVLAVMYVGALGERGVSFSLMDRGGDCGIAIRACTTASEPLGACLGPGGSAVLFQFLGFVPQHWWKGKRRKRPASSRSCPFL
jgi:hypothetical protein